MLLSVLEGYKILHGSRRALHEFHSQLELLGVLGVFEDTLHLRVLIQKFFTLHLLSLFFRGERFGFELDQELHHVCYLILF